MRAIDNRSRKAVRWLLNGLYAPVFLAGLVTLVLVAGRLAVVTGQNGELPQREPITVLAPADTADAGKLAVGEKLFHDRRLSRDNALACVSCHRLDRAGDDGLRRSIGEGGRQHDFNAPTIFNATLNFRFNWRGEFRTLEAQNNATLLSPQVMNTTWDELLPRLGSDTYFSRAFHAAYGAPPTRTSVLDALATFQRSLMTPNARFDRYLSGEPGAITAEEMEGYRLFKAYGCVACHQGVNVGGNLFQKFGIFADPPRDIGTAATDLGRFTITGLEDDRHVFRVPSLRNVAVTAPYFHHGGTPTLNEAVAVMARVQLGRDIPTGDVELIVKFLGTLTGEYRGRTLVGAMDQRPP